MRRYLLFVTYLIIPLLAVARFSSGENYLVNIPFILSAADLLCDLSKKVSYLFVMGIFFFEEIEGVSYYHQGSTFNLPFIYHMRMDVVSFGIGAYWHLILLIMILGAIFVGIDKKLPGCNPRRVSFFAVVLVIIFLPNSVNRFSEVYYDFLKVGSVKGHEIRYDKLAKFNLDVVKPNNLRVEVPQRPKNLILIYLESLERSYLKLPGLVPNLKRYLREGFEFTNFQQEKGVSWTIGGMIGSQCGIPLIPFHGRKNHAVKKNSVYENITCLGDILGKAGYHQVYMGGARKEFSGKNKYYKAHGYNKILGLNELKGFNKDKRYLNNFGLYDDSLFKFVGTEFKKIKKKEPFNLTFLTLDTHGDMGYKSKNCPRYAKINNTMLDAVHCSDFLLGKFIEDIRKDKELFENTLIFVMSDHLARRNVAESYYPKKRKLLAFALNSGLVGKNNNLITHFDIPRVLLKFLGIKSTNSFLVKDEFDFYENDRKYPLIGEEEFLELTKFVSFKNNKRGILYGEEGITLLDWDLKMLGVGNGFLIINTNGEANLPDKETFFCAFNNNGQPKYFKNLDQKVLLEKVRENYHSIILMLGKNKLPFYKGKEQGWKWIIGIPSESEFISGQVNDLRKLKIPFDNYKFLLN